MATKLLSSWGAALPPTMLLNSVMQLSASQLAPVLPYALMVLVLVWRPQGLLGPKGVS
jgi:branched-chain amino acid transport system permease protein